MTRYSHILDNYILFLRSWIEYVGHDNCNPALGLRAIGTERGVPSDGPSKRGVPSEHRRTVHPDGPDAHERRDERPKSEERRAPRPSPRVPSGAPTDAIEVAGASRQRPSPSNLDKDQKKVWIFDTNRAPKRASSLRLPIRSTSPKLSARC